MIRTTPVFARLLPLGRESVQFVAALADGATIRIAHDPLGDDDAVYVEVLGPDALLTLPVAIRTSAAVAGYWLEIPCRVLGTHCEPLRSAD